MEKAQTTALIILDGFGLSENMEGNATKQAKTPTIDNLYASCPHTTLAASGNAVGLMEGQMGDSNVGHLNIGAGRIVYQDVALITKSVKDGSFFKNAVLLETLHHAKEKNSALHLMGLVSPGGVHSHSDHLYALLQMAKDEGLEKVYVHAFLDGRDVPPKSAKEYLENLEQRMKELGVGVIATVSGRYYAMDRDTRWERLKKAWDAMVLRLGVESDSALEHVQAAYDQGLTDEFVLPGVIKGGAAISDSDAVFFFNFRADRARQLTYAFTKEDFPHFERVRPCIYYATMAQYDEAVKVPCAYPPVEKKNTLGEVLSKNHKTQLRIAETEKYAHVTFFFNGGVEIAHPLEDRILVPSPSVPTYDLKPEMSANEVAEEVVKQIRMRKYDVIVLNFANCDMVGHTGILEKAVLAVEAVDRALAKVLAALKEVGGRALITADHGNAEQMLDEKTQQPHTAHTCNLVPLWLFNEKNYRLKPGILSDLAPTLLHLMQLEKPLEMTSESLLLPNE